MRVVVLGASGATGRLAVQNLLRKGIQVRIVVRESAKVDRVILEDKNTDVIKGNIHDFSVSEMKELIRDCSAVICCLGHNISFKGIYGPPYKLVSDTADKAVKAIRELNPKIKFILMSTTAYTNKNLGEKNSFGEKMVFGLLSLMLPPHSDNMAAADNLVYNLGSNIEWTAVRPDSLIDEESESAYEVYDNKVRSPIFNSGKTSRINVGSFMSELVTDDDLWARWKNRTPVIYNKEYQKS